ncbi:GDP-mannose 4,6 dehydratase [Paraburkholderia hospita]|nr:GDP-mannose 4,6 dehydratase [Paraburkholderia hospita]
MQRADVPRRQHDLDLRIIILCRRASSIPVDPAGHRIIGEYDVDFYTGTKDNIAHLFDCANFATSEVYGDARVHQQTEDYWGHMNPIDPRSCYDEGKRCAETLFMDYRRQHGLDIRITRLFNTMGHACIPPMGGSCRTS